VTTAIRINKRISGGIQKVTCKRKKEKKHQHIFISLFAMSKHDSSVEEQTSTSKCPVDHTAYAHFLSNSKTDATEGQNKEALNPANYMPAPNQERADNQRMPLDTQRELSTIPMAASTRESAGHNENACPTANGDNKHGVWVYPSQQMFFNALRRKNWNPNEEDMQTVVPIHNAVNERAWKEILKWEHMHERYVD
jgi:cytochrome c heme-lyase